MKIIFRLRFHTRPGQSLWLTGNHKIFGGDDIAKAVPLQYLNTEFWQAAVEIPGVVPGSGVNYRYVLRDADGSMVQDWGQDRSIEAVPSNGGEMLIIDSWNDPGARENVFITEPFQEVLFKGNSQASPLENSKSTHVFRVKAPLLGKGHVPCLVGSAGPLGQWNTEAPVLLTRVDGGPYFAAAVSLDSGAFPVEYKYGVFDAEAKRFIRFEDGTNRILRDGPASNRLTIVNDGFARIPLEPWKGAGVAIPVFSLRSENSFGVGEFADLKLLADWCAQTGLKLIQILPINDTTSTHTWTDSYPYGCISAFALHPMYLKPGAVATGRNKTLHQKLEPERKRLNELEAVDYEAVMKAKLEFIGQIYPSQKSRTFKSKAFKEFFEKNRHWLEPYAVFCYLRDQHGTSDFSRWPEHRDFDAAAVAKLAAEDSPAFDEIGLNYFIQFHLHTQLKEAVDYAHEKGIILKGDIPIGVLRGGADAWQHRELFHLEAQAGAPPDAFAEKGQNWGFPTYNWERMKQDGFAWWKQRFEQMSCYFDAFRIDHILGFFRIWTIPAHAVEGILGRFVPAIPVGPEEFAARGIHFDHARYTQPFINDAVLLEIFGADAGRVKSEFLNPDAAGQWKLKSEFATQRQVEKHFSQLEKSEQNERLKAGLYDVISNVILFEESPGQYHFRLGIDKTTSFQQLDGRARSLLWELYIDYFFRRQDDFWEKEGMEKLPALKRSTNMLICGEDLGMVPACVPGVMKRLGLLSLEIQRMPKKLGDEFFRPAVAPYLSVVTPSTHDMSTIRGWWEEDHALTRKFYNTELNRTGDAPRHCEPWIAKAIIEQHLASPAMWSIFQLQDWLGMDGNLRRQDPDAERINVPAIVKHYWRYRMHLTLEELCRAEAFNHEVEWALKRNGR